MPQNCRQCFIVHTAFQCAGGKGVAQSVEGKVADVGILQHVVVIVLEGLLLNVVTELVGHYKAIVSVLIPCPNLVLLLLFLPASEFVNHCSGQWDGTAGVFCLGGAKYDFGFVLSVVGFVLGKAVDGTPDVKLGGAEINVFPLQC